MSSDTDTRIYLIHLERPIAHSQHYLGASDSLQKRLDCHRSKRGSKFLAEAVRLNIPFQVVRVWIGSWLDESRLKRQKSPARFCPICNDKARQPTNLKEIFYVDEVNLET